MRTPREIYAAYKIMPNLQLHQLRVAAVGKLICDNFSSEGGSASGGQKTINANDVILACLLHDMGNILKFDLTQFPEFREPQGIAYWEEVKTEFKQKYGPEQHAATVSIGREIGVSAPIIELLQSTGFSKTLNVASSTSTELKILQYADMRVGPHGTLSLDERLEDLNRRYAGKKGQSYLDAQKGGREIEGEIFSHTSIKPEDITDAAIAPVIEELWEYPVA